MGRAGCDLRDVAKRRRPSFTDAARLLIHDVAQRLEEFAHLQPRRILVVAGEARRGSRASIKPLTFGNPDGGEPNCTVSLVRFPTSTSIRSCPV